MYIYIAIYIYIYIFAFKLNAFKRNGHLHTQRTSENQSDPLQDRVTVLIYLIIQW